MANEIRLRKNFMYGTITDNPLTSGATTINSAAFANLPVVDSTSHLAISLAPGGVDGAGSAATPEIVWITAHTGSATSATVLRAQEGTTASSFVTGTKWEHSPTTYDFSASASTPHTRVYRNTTTSVSSSNVATTFTTVVTDNIGGWSSGSPTRITAMVAGKYLIMGSVSWNTGQNNGRRMNSIVINGSAIAQTEESYNSTVGGYPTLEVVAVYDMNVGDYAEFYNYSDAASVSTLSGGWMSMTLISQPTTTTPATTPAVRVTHSTTQSISTGTWTAVTFNTDIYKTDLGMHSTTTNATRLVCTVAGRYQVTGNVNWPVNATGQRLIGLAKNGGSSYTVFEATSTTIASGTYNINQNVSQLIDLAAGDYIELTVYQDSGGGLNINSASNYSPCLAMSLQQAGSVSTNTIAAPPALRVTKAAAQSITTATWTAITFDTERYKTDAGMHSTSVNPSRMICTVAGKYWVSGTIAFAANATGQRIAGIAKNGGSGFTVMESVESSVTNSASNGTYINVGGLIDMAIGDYVEIAVYQDSGGALNANQAAAYAPDGQMVLISSPTPAPVGVITSVNFRNTGAATTTTSASYSNYSSGYTATFVKKYSASRVRLSGAFTAYVNAAGLTHFGLQINSVDYEVARLYYNFTGGHMTLSGFNEIAGGVLSAGTYTVQLRWASNGTLIFQTDSNDQMSFLVEEVM